MGGSAGATAATFRQWLTGEISFSRWLVLAAVVLTCCGLGSFLGVTPVRGQNAANIGQFSAVTTWPYQAVHAHLLPNGKVLWWPAFDNGDNPTLWNPATNANTAINRVGANIFCAGFAGLTDGRLLVAGGHAGTWIGLPNAYIFNPTDNSWTRLPDMNNGRWYPTSTTLPNGDVLVSSGTINASTTNVEPQVWQTATNSWRNLTSAHLELPFYPYMFVAPNGKVFCAGPGQTTRYLNVTGTGSWSLVGNSNYGTRNWGSAVMYDTGKVLLTGGSPCRFYQTDCTINPTATAEVIDLNSPTPTWSYTGSMVTGPRKLHNATLLPDGKVFVSGGNRDTASPNNQTNAPAYECEMWDPATGTWSQMASLTKLRAYHATAVLLPDGRVLSAGGAPNGSSAEIYSPPYLFRGSRPAITTAPASITYSQSFFVGSPDAAGISKVSLIALPSVTHGFNMSQRIVTPSFSQTTSGLNVTAPSSANIAPPGHYMLFILNSNGVPSVAKILQISSSTVSPTPTPSATATPTATPTSTATPTPTPTQTPSPTATATAIPSPTATATALPTASPTATATANPTATATATASATATATVAPTSTPSATPAAPSNLTATAVSSSQINLAWTDNSNNEKGFKIDRSTDGNNFTQINTVGPNATKASNLRLVASTTYYYRVRAYNTNGDSAYSNTANATTFPRATPTATASATSTPTATTSPTATATVTSTPTNTPTASSTPTVVPSPSATATATVTPTATATPIATATATATSTSTVVPTPTATATYTPTPAPTGTATATATATVTASVTPTPTVEPSSSPTATVTQTPTLTPTATASATATTTATATPTMTATPTATESPSATETPSPSQTPTATPLSTPTPTPMVTPTP